MIKNLFIAIIASLMLISCGNQDAANKEENLVNEEIVISEEPMALGLAEFREKAGELVGTQVTLEGMVLHVCRHGGDKMFITADDPDIRIKITASGDMAVFQPELEGSYVVVTGIVEEMKAEVIGEGELHDDEDHEDDEDHVNHYHKPQYSVSYISYIVKEAPAGTDE